MALRSAPSIEWAYSEAHAKTSGANPCARYVVLALDSRAWKVPWGHMDQFARAYYEVVFERDYLKRNGDAFQDFFATLMEKRYPGDFIRVRAWGNVGDKKNDGYLATAKTIFQCYAPNEMSAAKAVAKINEDFNGARVEWANQMRGWKFVHNSRNGLGPDIVATLLQLASEHDTLDIGQWGYEELRVVAFQLGDHDLASLLGPAPTSQTLLNLAFEDVRQVLEALQIDEQLDDCDVRPVPADKLAHNRLSPPIQSLLRLGMTKADLVGGYFDRHPDPNLGDRIAQAVRQRYQVVRGQGRGPDETFFALQEFVGGTVRGTPAHETAVLAVLAHLFEQCEIFERPTGQYNGDLAH